MRGQGEGGGSVKCRSSKIEKRLDVESVRV